MRTLARFTDDGFVSGEQIDSFRIIDEHFKEAPFDARPVDLGMEEALHRAIASSGATPACDAALGDASCHGEHGLNDAMELPTVCFGQNGREHEQNG